MVHAVCCMVANGAPLEERSIKAVKKADCKPIPLKTDFKVGDTVYVPFVGTMSKGTVTKAASKGRYGFKYESGSKADKMFSFGEVVKEL